MTRFRVVDGPPADLEGDWFTDTANPTAGGVVHVIQGSDLSHWPASTHSLYIGAPCRIEAGGTFSDGDLLATDSQGRAVQATTGDIIVAKALEGAVQGEVVWIVLESQREM